MTASIRLGAGAFLRRWETYRPVIQARCSHFTQKPKRINIGSTRKAFAISWKPFAVGLKGETPRRLIRHRKADANAHDDARLREAAIRSSPARTLQLGTITSKTAAACGSTDRAG